MALKTTKWDVTEFLEGDEHIAVFLEAAFEDGDPALITAALGDVARAIGMTRISRETGISRETLYRAFNADGNSESATALKVLKSFHSRLAPGPAKQGHYSA